MALHVQNLSSIPFESLIDCFLKAFEGYFVKMPQEVDYYRNRWKAAKVDYSQSYGMFDGDTLVGFIIHAVDTRNGVLTAYNTGTGVIPSYRGKGVTKAIYKHALDRLIANGIKYSTLEVITENHAAIVAYKGVGFKITKTYKCFGGTLHAHGSIASELSELPLKQVPWNRLPNQEYYSWDNQQSSIIGGKYRFFYVLHEGIPQSYFIINEDLNYLAQLDVLQDGERNWQRLFSGIMQLTKDLRINNVDSRLKEKINSLSLHGLTNTIDQCEMELILKN